MSFIKLNSEEQREFNKILKDISPIKIKAITTPDYLKRLKNNQNIKRISKPRFSIGWDPVSNQLIKYPIKSIFNKNAKNANNFNKIVDSLMKLKNKINEAQKVKAKKAAAKKAAAKKVAAKKGADKKGAAKKAAAKKGAAKKAAAKKVTVKKSKITKV